MRELWRDEHAAVATRRHRPLPLQRLRTLLQDERTEPTTHQAQAETGECKNPTNFLVYSIRLENMDFMSRYEPVEIRDQVSRKFTHNFLYTSA